MHGARNNLNVTRRIGRALVILPIVLRIASYCPEPQLVELASKLPDAGRLLYLFAFEI